jgi:hypothetical protein
MRLVLRDNAPCPQGDGTQIGGTQQFNLFCGKTIEGDEMETIDAASLSECVEQCAFFHPKCEAVTFSERERCRLKNNIRPSDTKPSRFLDAAAALFPQMPPSDCTNSVRAAGNSNFQLFCGQIFNGGDLTQIHSQTLNGCMQQCASNQQCAGISFDASLNQGFMNCYLKNAVPSANMVASAGIDSAVLGAAAADPAPAPVVPAPVPVPVVPQPAPAPTVVQPQPAPAQPTVIVTPPASTVIVSQPAQTVTVVPETANPGLEPSAPANTPPQIVPGGFSTAQPQPVQEPLTTTGGAFFTPVPPAVNTAPAALPSSVPVTSIQTQTLVSVVTSASEVISITQVVTVPVTTFRPVTGLEAPTGTPVPQLPGDQNSLSWVAAPVVGGIAAILVVVVMFVMFRRRRGGAGGGGSRGSGSGSKWSWKPSFGFVSNRKFPSIGGAGSWRSMFRPDAQRLEDGPEEKGGKTPRYEVRGGKMSLRDGDQSRPSTAGMGFFRR